MANAKDTYEGLYELQTDDTKGKLKGLYDQISKHISSSPLDKFEQAFNGEKKDVKLSAAELMIFGYTQRMSKDIIMKYVTGGKSEKLGLGDRLIQKFLDKGADMVLKQKNSYDSVLSQVEVPVLDKFKQELDELKKSIVVSSNNSQKQPDNAAATNATEETPSTHPDAMKKAEVDEIIAKYPPDMKGYCLKEVRTFMQHLHSDGLVDLPDNLRKGSWGSAAKDFGTDIKYYQDNFPKDWDLKKFADHPDDADKNTKEIADMKGSIFNLVLTNKQKPAEAGHICVAFRQGGKIMIYDNSFAVGADMGEHRFSLENYLKRRTEEGKYRLDAVIGMPLAYTKLVAYKQRTTTNNTATQTA